MALTAAAGFALGIHASTWWQVRIDRAAETPVAVTAGYTQHAAFGRCRPVLQRDWRSGFRRTHACMARTPDGQVELIVSPRGEAVTAAQQWRRLTPTEWSATRDSVLGVLHVRGARPAQSSRESSTAIWCLGRQTILLGAPVGRESSRRDSSTLVLAARVVPSEECGV